MKKRPRARRRRISIADDEKDYLIGVHVECATPSAW